MAKKTEDPAYASVYSIAEALQKTRFDTTEKAIDAVSSQIAHLSE